jgi:hypothetical protein
MMQTLTGTVRTWKLFGHTRQFSEVTLPYREATELFMPVPYNGLSGKGEQRDINPAHLRKLKKAMEVGNYTPTPGSVGLRNNHRDALARQTHSDGTQTFSLEVNRNDPLPLTDAGHRMQALGAIVKELQVRLGKAADETERAKLQAQLDEVQALPITFTLYLDGDPQKDFVNLQAGRTVDSAQMFSLRVQQAGDDPCKLAFEVAKKLHNKNESPFKNTIRFDSRGPMPLPVSNLCGKGGSDLATSLVGLAKVSLAAETPLGAGALAGCVVAAYQALKTKAPELIGEGKVLTPIAEAGTKGSATMMIGLGICLAHRMVQLGQDKPSQPLLDDLVGAAQATMNESVKGGFSGPAKRQLMGRFARVFYAGENVAKHDGLPISLLKTLSASAFGAEPLPKAKDKPKAEVVAA